MDDAISETVRLYAEVRTYYANNPEDTIGISQRIDRVLEQSLDAYLYDIDSVTRDGVMMMFKRTLLIPERIAALAVEGVSPYNRPITEAELRQETPGMIPILLLRAILCYKFHYMPINMSHVKQWKRFCKFYMCKLPNND